jgi:PilZ domain
MLSPSEGATPSPSPGRRERRCRYRRPFHSLAYVKLSSENGGILRDISDHGAALQSVAPLQLGQTVHLHFDLLGPQPMAPRRHIEVEGSVAWVSPSGQAGVRFRNLGDSARRQLNEWILAGLLTSIAQLSPVLNSAEPLLDENLQLAGVARAPIALAVPATARRVTPASDEDLLLDWLLDRISPRALSLAVDGLVLSVAALLFLVVALAVAKTMPGVVGALAITAGVLCFCWLLYRGMCHFFGTPTAGRWVAQHAVEAWEAEHQGAEPAPRFR